MKTRNLLAMVLILFATTITPQGRSQTARDVLSAKIRSHITSSAVLSQNAQQSNESEYLESSDSGFFSLYSPYGASDLWMELTGITNDLVSLTLWNTQSNMYCQLLTNRDLLFPKDWGFGQIVRATNDTTLFAPEGMYGDKSFYRGIEGFPIVSIETQGDAVEPTNAFSGQPGFFLVSISDSLSTNLTVFYKISGSAQNGVD
jgi:hypothetical protein